MNYQDNIKKHIEVFEKLNKYEENFEKIAEKIYLCLINGNKLMLCGNGGSAADAQHIAAEFTGRYLKDRIPLAALALSTDTSAITCISNDYSFENIFERQINALGQKGDCILLISTSGNSKNIIKAAEASKEKGITTIGMLGKDGGELKNLCDISLIIENNSTARIQEAHIFIGHCICEYIEEKMGF